jgi:hypothetical protein
LDLPSKATLHAKTQMFNAADFLTLNADSSQDQWDTLFEVLEGDISAAESSEDLQASFSNNEDWGDCSQGAFGDDPAIAVQDISTQNVSPEPIKRKGNVTHEHLEPPLKKKRTRLKNFVCSDPCCGKAFADNAHLKDHMLIHSGKKNFSCTDCGKRFARTSSLKSHLRVHTGEKPFVCEHCGKAYASRGGLKMHTVSHTGVRPFSCAFPGCNKQFATSQQVKKHALRHKKIQTQREEKDEQPDEDSIAPRPVSPQVPPSEMVAKFPSSIHLSAQRVTALCNFQTSLNPLDLVDYNTGVGVSPEVPADPSQLEAMKREVDMLKWALQFKETECLKLQIEMAEFVRSQVELEVSRSGSMHMPIAQCEMLHAQANLVLSS